MTRSLNVTPKTTICSGKYETQVTIIKESALIIILLRLTTDGHKASCGLSATAELLVSIVTTANVDQFQKIISLHSARTTEKNGIISTQHLQAVATLPCKIRVFNCATFHACILSIYNNLQNVTHNCHT